MQIEIDELSNRVFDVYDDKGNAIARLEHGAYLSMDIAIGRFVPTDGKVEGDLLAGLVLGGRAGQFVARGRKIFLITECGEFEVRRFP